jgi:hypothetical protein
MPFAPQNLKVRVTVEWVVQADVIERGVGHGKPRHLRIGGASSAHRKKIGAAFCS